MEHRVRCKCGEVVCIPCRVEATTTKGLAAAEARAEKAEARAEEHEAMRDGVEVHNEALRAENKRLRAALRDLANYNRAYAHAVYLDHGIDSATLEEG